MIDINNPVNGVAKEDRITEAHVPAKEEDLVFVPRDANEDLEVAVSSADAIYLLYHVLFGKERYPLA